MWAALPVTALLYDYLSRRFLIPNSVPSAKFQKAGTPVAKACIMFHATENQSRNPAIQKSVNLEY